MMTRIALCWLALSFAAAQAVDHVDPTNNADQGESSKYDDLVWEAMNGGSAVERVPYSDVLRLQDGNETIRVAHLLALLPESRNGQVDDIGHTLDAFLAVRDFNRRRSVFPESTLEVDTQDCDLYLRLSYRDSGRSFFRVATEWADAFFPARQSAPEQLPLAVVGPAASHMSATVPTLAAATSNDPRGENEGVVTVSYGSTAAYLDDKTRFPWFARTSTTDSRGIAQALLQYLESLKVRRLALLTVDSGFALDVVQHILGRAQRDPLFRHSYHDIVVVSYVEKDLASMANAAQQLHSHGIVYHVGIQLSEAMLLQLYDSGLLGNNPSTNNTTTTKTTTAWTFYGSVTTNYMTRRTLVDDDSNSIHRIEDVHRALHQSTYITTSTTTWAEEITRTNRAILDHYHRIFPDDKEAVQYVLQRHDGRGIFGEDPDLYHSTLLANAKGDTKKRWYTYDAILAVGIAACQAPSLKTSVLMDTLRSLNFRGASYARVDFNRTTGTRLPHHVAYKLYNLQQLRGVSTTTINGSTTYTSQVLREHALTFEFPSNASSSFWLLVEEVEPVIYAPDGSTTPPPSIPPVKEDRMLVSMELRAFCWAIAALVIAASLACGMGVFYHRKRPNLVASQPLFLILLCAGTWFMGCSIIPLPFQEPMPQKLLDVGCMLHIWLVSIGFSTTFAVLLAKTWRINRVYQSALRFQRNRIKAKGVIWIPALVFAVNIALLTIWSAVDPLQWNRIVTEQDIFGRSLKSEGTCHSLDSLVGPVCGIGLIVINFGAFVVAGHQAYLARQLPGAINETAGITVAICIILEVFLIGIPLLSVLEVHPGAYMLVASWIIAIAAMALLVPLVGTKLLIQPSSTETVLDAGAIMASVKNRGSNNQSHRSNYNTSGNKISGTGASLTNIHEEEQFCGHACSADE